VLVCWSASGRWDGIAPVVRPNLFEANQLGRPRPGAVNALVRASDRGIVLQVGGGRGLTFQLTGRCAGGDQGSDGYGQGKKRTIGPLGVLSHLK
jgi:hypothetical protein